MKKQITENDRHNVYLYLMDNYSRHAIAKLAAQQMDKDSIAYYLHQIHTHNKEKSHGNNL